MTSDIENGNSRNTERTILVPIVDGRPVGPDETADLAELDSGNRLTRSTWLQDVRDVARGGKPTNSAIFRATQARIANLSEAETRNFGEERRSIILAYNALRIVPFEPAITQVWDRQIWLQYRSDEAYVAPYNRLEPGKLAPHITAVANSSKFATGWELGYEGTNAERWFVTHTLITPMERLDLPLNSIHQVGKVPIGRMVEIDGVEINGLKLIRVTSLQQNEQ